MAENRNVAVVDDFEGITGEVEQRHGEDASERDGNSEGWEKA